MLSTLRVFAQERQQMPRVPDAWILAPLDLDGCETRAMLDDEINFHPVASTQVMEPSFAEVLQALPQLDAHPLLIACAGIDLYNVR